SNQTITTSSQNKLDNASLQKPFKGAITNDGMQDNKGRYTMTQQAINIEKNPKNGKIIVVGEIVIKDPSGKIMTFKDADGQMKEARFIFRSGGFDKGYMPGLDGKIPNLTYKLDWDNMRTTDLKKGMMINGKGFFLPLLNTRNLN